MRYFIIAGEASGDMHAARLIEALKARDAESTFVGMGGDKMAQAGCSVLLHYSQMAYMGIVDVLLHLPKISHNFSLAHRSLLQERPDALILVDYPSFNLRIARFCRKQLPDTRIYYYIPPKVWAWKTWRIHRIARYSQKVFTIFPFEPAFYERYGYHTEYVGNPTATALAPIAGTNKPTQPVIAILPGSRKHEIDKCLGKMLKAASGFSGYKLVVAQAPSIDPSVYETIISQTSMSATVSLTTDTYSLLQQAQAAIVNSGTATLETAIIGCPQVAVYHLAFGHVLNLIRPLLFKIPHFTLPNIIMGKEVIRELLAYEFTEDNVYAETSRLLNDSAYRQTMLNNYALLRDTLGKRDAPTAAADSILSDLR